jgi:hypothetical protein
METSMESIRMGLVQRAVALGLAFIATSILFTSVVAIFTAGANGTVAGRVALAAVTTVSGV